MKLKKSNPAFFSIYKLELLPEQGNIDEMTAW